MYGDNENRIWFTKGYKISESYGHKGMFIIDILNAYWRETGKFFVINSTRSEMLELYPPVDVG